jgi:flagellar protein FliS
VYTNSRNAAHAYADVDRQTGVHAAEPAASQPAPLQQAVSQAGQSMYASSRGIAHAYAKGGLETGLLAASPHQLIVMLYEGAELAVRMAIKHMNEGDIAKKSAAITKASSIILDGLKAALDPQQGGDIAQRLDALYDYMNQRLVLAHLNNQTAPLEEVLGLLRELHGAWQQIGSAGSAAPQSSHASFAA